MDKLLIIVDMQNDFIDGALANPAAQAIVAPMAEYIKKFNGDITFTRDTHSQDYLKSQEGKNLPIEHCIRGTDGWNIREELWHVPEHGSIRVVDKESFGDISQLKTAIDETTKEILICGTCTDICVVSVALNLKAAFPEMPITCLESLCAGLSPEKHAAAIEVMKSCQVNVI